MFRGQGRADKTPNGANFVRTLLPRRRRLFRFGAD